MLNKFENYIFSKHNFVNFNRFPVLIKLSNIVETYEKDNFHEKRLIFCIFMKNVLFWERENVLI